MREQLAFISVHRVLPSGATREGIRPSIVLSGRSVFLQFGTILYCNYSSLYALRYRLQIASDLVNRGQVETIDATRLISHVTQPRSRLARYLSRNALQ